MGYTVVEPSAVLATHLQEVLRKDADKILGRQETKKLIENLKKDYPAVVEELSTDLLPTGTIQKVLQNLLREGIPIRDLVTILESLADYSRVTKNVDVLTEYVRHALSRDDRPPVQRCARGDSRDRHGSAAGAGDHVRPSESAREQPQSRSVPGHHPGAPSQSHRQQGCAKRAGSPRSFCVPRRCGRTSID